MKNDQTIVSQTLDEVKEFLDRADRIFSKHPFDENHHDMREHLVKNHIELSFGKMLFLLEVIGLNKIYDQVNNLYEEAQKDEDGFLKKEWIEDIHYLFWSAKLRTYLNIIEDTMDSTDLEGRDRRELGRLRRERSKWDDSIIASVSIGIYCAELSKNKTVITRDMLTDKIYDLKLDLPKTTIEKIWKAIPDKYRKKAGRPRKK